jgi:predicted RNase H-like nuclease
MNFVGVDLAWGERSGTGLCVLLGEHVVDATRLRSLDDIVSWLTPYTSGDCIVAIDAPLIVRNQSGRRACEDLISRCFGKYEAGAHSSNLANACFRTGGRARELARRLGLDTDPAMPGGAPVRRALEVYPHTALVALFDLPVTLKYKAKRGRTLSSRQAEFARCASLLESLATAEPPIRLGNSPRWIDLTEEIRSATTGAGLDRAEDELDAYICAYTALHYWVHGLDRSRIVGDTESGYIVTPVAAEQARWLDAALSGSGEDVSGPQPRNDAL